MPADMEPYLSVEDWGDVRFRDPFAGSVGDANAAAEAVHEAAGTPGFLVRRFDRVGDPSGRVVSLAQEDACQVLGRYPADKYRVTTEAVMGALAGVCQAASVAAYTLLMQTAFAYLTCNGEAHAKKFSVCRLPDGEWRVTRAYDLPTSHPYGDTTMALPINGRPREDIGRADFIALGEAVGLRASAVERALDELRERAEIWIADLDMLPSDGRRIHKSRRTIEYRRDRLAGRSS